VLAAARRVPHAAPICAKGQEDDLLCRIDFQSCVTHELTLNPA
jgi:hypothetical protein